MLMPSPDLSRQKVPPSTKFRANESEAARTELLNYKDQIPSTDFNRLQLCRIIGNSAELRMVTPHNVRTALQSAGLDNEQQQAVWNRILGQCDSFSQILRRKMMSAGKSADAFAEEAGSSATIIRSLLHGNPGLWETWRSVAVALGQDEPQALDEWRDTFATRLCKERKNNILGARIVSIFESTPSASYRMWFEEGKMPEALQGNKVSENTIRKLIGSARRGENLPWEMVDRLLHALEVSNQERMKVADAWLTVQLHPADHPSAPKRLKKADTEVGAADEDSISSDDASPPELNGASVLKGFHFDPALAGKTSEEQLIALLITFMTEHSIPLPEGKIRSNMTLSDLQDCIQDALRQSKGKTEKKKITSMDFTSVMFVKDVPRHVNVKELTPELLIQLCEMIERLLRNSENGEDPDLPSTMQYSVREHILLEQMGISGLTYSRLQAHVSHIRHHAKGDKERTRKRTQLEIIRAGLEGDTLDETFVRKGWFFFFGEKLDDGESCHLAELLEKHPEPALAILERFMQESIYREKAIALSRSLPERVRRWFVALSPIQILLSSIEPAPAPPPPPAATVSELPQNQDSEALEETLDGDNNDDDETGDDETSVSEDDVSTIGEKIPDEPLTAQEWFEIRRIRLQQGKEETESSITPDQCGTAFLELMDELDHFEATLKVGKNGKIKGTGSFVQPELLGARYRYLANSTSHRLAIQGRAQTLEIPSATFLCLERSTYVPDVSTYDAEREGSLLVAWGVRGGLPGTRIDDRKKKKEVEKGEKKMGPPVEDLLEGDLSTDAGDSGAPSELPTLGTNAILPSTPLSKGKMRKTYEMQRRVAKKAAKKLRKKNSEGGQAPVGKEVIETKSTEQSDEPVHPLPPNGMNHPMIKPSNSFIDPKKGRLPLNGTSHPMVSDFTPEQLEIAQRMRASRRKGGGSTGSNGKDESV